MPYRPSSIHRKNRPGVIYPLTAAIRSIYGVRRDGAYPIGAFYTVNIDSRVWEHVEGIWYRPYSPNEVEDRAILEENIEIFSNSIRGGEPVTLRTGTVVDWELIPAHEANQLPRP